MSAPVSSTALVRSIRNGVEAMVKVTASEAISRAAISRSQLSISTIRAPSMTGIRKPYMNPV